MKNELNRGDMPRRDFLKACGITFGAVGVAELETTLRPVGWLAGVLSHCLGLPEGNLLDFYSVYSSLASKAYLQPQKPDNAKNFEAFLALSGTVEILSAAACVTPVARLGEVTLRHFLYGSGPMDLTPQVSENITAEFSAADPASDPNTNFIRGVLTPGIFTSGKVKYANNAICLVGTVDAPGFGFQSSLGHFGLTLTGEMHREKSGIEVTQPSFCLFDRYDFSVDTPNPPTGKLAGAFEFLANRLHLSVDAIKRYIPEPLKLSHSANLLQKNGIARPFDISAGKFLCGNSVMVPASLL